MRTGSINQTRICGITTVGVCVGAAGIGLGTTMKYLRHMTSAATGSGLGTTIKFLVNQNVGAGTNLANVQIIQAGGPFQNGTAPSAIAFQACY